jgi:hypothetical protein
MSTIILLSLYMYTWLRGVLHGIGPNDGERERECASERVEAVDCGLDNVPDDRSTGTVLYKPDHC